MRQTPASRRKRRKPNTPSPMTREEFNSLNLKPELVPAPLWSRNLRHALGPKSKKWETIRQDTIASSEGKCAYCGAHYDKGIICHEVWQYDDARHVATLTGFQLVCRDCSAVVHFGFTTVLGAGFVLEKPRAPLGLNLIGKAKARFITLSRISSAKADAALAFAFKQHSERSRHSWQLRLSLAVVAKYPFLADVRL